MFCDPGLYISVLDTLHNDVYDVEEPGSIITSLTIIPPLEITVPSDIVRGSDRIPSCWRRCFQSYTFCHSGINLSEPYVLSLWNQSRRFGVIVQETLKDRR
jgi:hypothetical protein